MNKIIETGFGVLITLFALLDILLIVSLIPVNGHIRVLTVLSGSMEPALHVGSIVIIAPQTNYKVGDVITFGEIGNAKTPTTHRIKDVKIVDGNAVYLTQGDANESADSHEVAQSEVVGKVLFSIPFIGYALNFVKQPLGFGLVIIIPAVLIIWEEMKKINRELAKNRKKSNNSLK